MTLDKDQSLRNKYGIILSELELEQNGCMVTNDSSQYYRHKKTGERYRYDYRFYKEWFKV